MSWRDNRHNTELFTLNEANAIEVRNASTQRKTTETTKNLAELGDVIKGRRRRPHTIDWKLFVNLKALLLFKSSSQISCIK